VAQGAWARVAEAGDLAGGREPVVAVLEALAAGAAGEREESAGAARAEARGEARGEVVPAAGQREWCQSRSEVAASAREVWAVGSAV
jgi:hypothetical protein